MKAITNTFSGLSSLFVELDLFKILELAYDYKENKLYKGYLWKYLWKHNTSKKKHWTLHFGGTRFS